MSRLRSASPLALALLAALGCAPVAEEAAADPVAKPALAWCVGRPFTPAAAQGFDHLASEVIALATPAHSMQDVIVAPGEPIVVRGKFAYGALSVDLPSEPVRVFLDDCSGWRALGDAHSDGDGRIAVTLPEPLPIGAYDVRLEVLGDGSLAPGRIWVLPSGTRLAISDIDGTLTTSDEELVTDVLTDLFEPIFAGEDVPAAWPGAADLTTALVERGRVIVYLTGRPYWLAGKTRAWLSGGGFAPGALHTTGSNAEALPTASGVGAYKLAFLRSLTAQGFVLDEAYGNATTDVDAYASAGIPADRSWIIGPNGGDGGTQAVTGSWDARAAEVLDGPWTPQPFAP